MTSRHVPFAVLALLLCATASPALAEEERTFRKLTLDNGLRVVLASDPGVNTSSASMGVGIGANADPEGAQGLAHFLEHMLFLGTDKYPKLNAYSDFLQARGGGSNAYTSQDHTNYHFQVNHDALPEALDRFSQFFISPTLDYTYAKREVMAVNSEHQKNTMDDTWRLMQLQRAHIKAGHPAGGFSTGNAETLQDAQQKVLRGFFDDYYKAPNMALAVLSNMNLDAQEAMVRERFAAIKGGAAKPWSTDGDLLDDAKGLRLLNVVPIKDLRELRIYFEVPPQQAHALSKIGSLVGMTMGDEGKGSLLSHLKALGLATTLSAGVGGTRYYSSCNVTVGLTPKGLTEWREVLRLCFAYTRMLQTSGFPRHVWEEMRTLAQLNDRYAAKPEGTQAAIDLANSALEFGLEVAERVATTFVEPDPAAYQALVDALQPKNCMVFLVAKGLETDATEQFYGTEYSSKVEEGKPFTSLHNVEVPAAIHLPLPNPFVPKDTTVQPEQPVLIQQDATTTLWYAQDHEFKRPKVAINLHILSPAAFGSPIQAALTGLYTSMLQEQLNELSYPALMAGLSYSLSPTRKGLLLQVSGYSDSAFELLSVVSSAMRGALDAETFDRVRLRSVEGAKNFPLGQAYMVVRELARKLTTKQYYTRAELLPILESATLADLKVHVGALLSRTHVEGLCAGNLTAAQAKSAVAGLQQALGSRPFDPAQAHRDGVLWLGPGEEIVVKRLGQTDQACLRMDYQVGASDVATRVAAEVIGRTLSSPFYTEMRTKQKLGYIVFSGAYNRQNVQNLVFLIQSGTHPAPELQSAADACLDSIPAMFAMIPPAQFDAIRNSLIEDRRKQPKSIAEKAGLFWASVFDKDADFAWLEAEIAALEALKLEQVVALVKATLDPTTRRRTVFLLAAKQHGPFAEPGTAPTFAGFSEGRTYTYEKAGH